MLMITVTEPQQLSGLLDLVHDWWFDVEKISHDQSACTVMLLLAEKQKELSLPGNRVLLRINNVRNIEIKDTERVGFYDLNEMIYDAASKTLKITGGVPINIYLIIDRLHIEVQKIG